MTRRRAVVALAAVSLALLAALSGGRAGAQVEPPPPDTPTTTAPAPTTTAPPAPAASPVEDTMSDVEEVFRGPTIGRYPDARYRFYSGDGTLKLDAPDAPGWLDKLPGGVGQVAQALKVLPKPPSLDTGVPTERTANSWVADSFFWSPVQDLVTIIRSGIHWAYTFGFLRALTPITERIAGFLNGIAFGRLHLADVVYLLVGLALFVRFVVHRRIGMFLADAGIAIILAVLAGILIYHPAVYFNGVAEVAGDAAQLPFRALTPDDSDQGLLDAEGALKEIQTVIPWQVVNYGRELTGPCADVGNDILASGPYGKTDDAPRVALLKAGCKQEATYNNDVTAGRVALLVILIIGVVSTALFGAVLLFSFIWAQLRLAWDFGRGAVSLIAGSSPWTRDIATGWLRRVGDDVLLIIAPSWVLAVMVVADQILIGLDGIPLGWRVVMVSAANTAIFFKRRKMANKVGAVLSGGLNRVSARSVRADRADIGSARANTRASGAHGAHEFMPGARWLTVPVAAAAIGAGRHMATGGKHVRTARSVATAAAGPAGAAVKATKAGAAMTATRTATAATAAAKTTAGTVRTVGAATTHASRTASSAASSRAAAYRARRDARRGEGHAPLGDRHGPHLADLGPVHGPHPADVDPFSPGGHVGPSLAELAAAETAGRVDVGGAEAAA